MSVRDEQELARRAAEARARGLQPWEADMADAVTTKIVREIATDQSLRNPPRMSSMFPDRLRSDEPARRPSGGTVEVKPPPGIDLIDRMCAEQDRADRAAAIRRNIETVLVETALAETLLEKGPRIELEYNPIDRKHMSK